MTLRKKPPEQSRQLDATKKNTDDTVGGSPTYCSGYHIYANCSYHFPAAAPQMPPRISYFKNIKAPTKTVVSSHPQGTSVTVCLAFYPVSILPSFQMRNFTALILGQFFTSAYHNTLLSSCNPVHYSPWLIVYALSPCYVSCAPVIFLNPAIINLGYPTCTPRYPHL